MPHPLPPVEHFSSEDALLLNEYPQLHSQLDVHPDQSDFEVTAFPKMPPLSNIGDVDDGEFSDFVQSLKSEIQSTSSCKHQQDSATMNLSDLPTLEYIAHVAVIILVQLFIPIPFMIPMAINFAKRALKILLPGFAVRLLGQSIANLVLALAYTRPFDQTSFHHLAQHLPSSSVFLPVLYGEVKMAALGGLIVGAVMAHVLNLIILGHTFCRLFRGLEPDSIAIRRAVDSSKTFQVARQIVLDLLTALFMIPAGLTARSWCSARLGLTIAHPPTDGLYTVGVGILGIFGRHVFQLVRHARTLVEIRRLQSLEGHTQTFKLQKGLVSL
jgi:hypothetical protein